MIDNLNAIMQIGKLVGLGIDAAGEDVRQHLRDFVEGGRFSAGLGLLHSLLVLLLLIVVVLLVLVDLVGVGFFAGGRTGGGDDELLDFEGIGVLGAGCGDTEMVAFGEFDLSGISTWLRK